MTDTSLKLLTEFRAMARTGRNSFTGQPISTALAARLPKIIAAAAERVKRGARQGQVSP